MTGVIHKLTKAEHVYFSILMSCLALIYTVLFAAFTLAAFKPELFRWLIVGNLC